MQRDRDGRNTWHGVVIECQRDGFGTCFLNAHHLPLGFGAFPKPPTFRETCKSHRKDVIGCLTLVCEGIEPSSEDREGMPTPLGFLHEAAEFIVFRSTNFDHKPHFGTKEEWQLRSFINQRGVPPFGHSTQLRVFVDPELL